MSHDTITDLRRRFNFFLDNAGGWVGHNAESAIALARAERYAEQQGWTFVWEYDDVQEYEFRTEQAEQYYGCILKDEYGVTLGSLWGIDTDPCPHGGGIVEGYGRVVQAELASEALHDIERRQQDDKDAERYMAL